MDWKVWYSEGRTFTSRDMSWADLPQDEFQAIVVYKPNGTPKVVSGCDYYWLDGDEIRTHVAATKPHPTIRHALVPVLEHKHILGMLVLEHGDISIKWGKWQSDEAQAAMMLQVQASAAAYRGEGAKWR